MREISVGGEASRRGGARRPLVLDNTLREGSQHAGVSFSAETVVSLVELLDEFGVDIVEVGHPAVSEAAFDACAAAAETARRAAVLMHARALPDEVERAAAAGATWVGIWASVNEVALATKFPGLSREQVEARVEVAVAEAKVLGLRVRFTVEDASRTGWEELRRVAGLAVGAGADCVSLADTVGAMHPRGWEELVVPLKEQLGCLIEVHCHNDLGLALANSLAAFEAGADVLDASVLGIGERSGVTDLLQLALVEAIHEENERFRLELSAELAELVCEAAGLAPESHRPIVGAHAFTHSSRYHQVAASRDPRAYEAFPPALVGRERSIGEPVASGEA